MILGSRSSSEWALRVGYSFASTICATWRTFCTIAETVLKAFTVGWLGCIARRNFLKVTRVQRVETLRVCLRRARSKVSTSCSTSGNRLCFRDFLKRFTAVASVDAFLDDVALHTLPLTDETLLCAFPGSAEVTCRERARPLLAVPPTPAAAQPLLPSVAKSTCGDCQHRRRPG